MIECYSIQYLSVSKLLLGPGETYVKNTNLIEIMSPNAQHPTYLVGYLVFQLSQG